MIESERQIVVKNIEKEIEMLQIKNDKIKQLENLEQKSLIQKYLKLKEEIELLTEKFRFVEQKEDTLKAIVLSNFAIGSIEFSPCSHPLWMYSGSYYNWLDYNCEHSHDILVDDENDKEFEFNRYYCLECHRYVDEKDWEKFEEKRFVLKDRNQLDTYFYRNLYYQLLYENTINETKEKIIKIFKENGKTKIKK